MHFCARPSVIFSLCLSVILGVFSLCGGQGLGHLRGLSINRGNAVHTSANCATDPVTTPFCEEGDGEDATLYCKAGIVYVACGIGGVTPEAPTLQGLFTANPRLTGADSGPTALTICNSTGTEGTQLYTDAILGPRKRAMTGMTSCAGGTPVTSNDWCEPTGDKNFYDKNGVLQATLNCTTGAWTFVGTLNGLTLANSKTIDIAAGAMSISGTCTDTSPVERTPVASGPKLYTIQIADDATCSLEFGWKFKAEDRWNAGTLSFEWEALSTANSNTETILLDCACQCVTSAAQIAAHSTTGEQRSTITFGNQTNDLRVSTGNAATTCNGSCASGSHVFARCQIDTGTTLTPVTDAHILGVKVTYGQN